MQTAQQPGCLPSGFGMDAMLTADEFCLWVRRSRKWFGSHRHILPGVRSYGRKDVRVHVRTYLEGKPK